MQPCHQVVLFHVLCSTPYVNADGPTWALCVSRHIRCKPASAVGTHVRRLKVPSMVMIAEDFGLVGRDSKLWGFRAWMILKVWSSEGFRVSGVYRFARVGFGDLEQDAAEKSNYQGARLKRPPSGMKFHGHADKDAKLGLPCPRTLGGAVKSGHRQPSSAKTPDALGSDGKQKHVTM